MIDFLKYRYIWASISILMLVGTIGTYFYRGGFNYSVDFTGGTQVLLKFSNKVEADKLKDILKNHGYKGIETREFSNNEVLVRVKEFLGDSQGMAEQIRANLQKELSGINVEILQTDSVGSGVGATLRSDSVKAVTIALILMLLYIAIRFKFAFAVGAIVALFHDVVAILFFFLLTNKEISVEVIGAMITILGYSINDTIVIFNQVRQNIKKLRGIPIYDIVNLSLNQTLRRTILLSFATALVVLALILFGGETLRNLSLALMIGIVVGTYSSIYIASPVMLLLYKGENK